MFMRYMCQQRLQDNILAKLEPTDTLYARFVRFNLLSSLTTSRNLFFNFIFDFCGNMLQLRSGSGALMWALSQFHYDDIH